MQQDPNSKPATGYPYPNQPHASAKGYPPNAYSYQNDAPHPDPRPGLIERIAPAMMVFSAIMFLLLLFILSHSGPQLPDVYINSLSVSNFNVSNVTGNWDLRLRFQNPNSNYSIYYDSVLCAVYYDDSGSLSETRLQPFDQGAKDQTLINATLSVSGTHVDRRLVDSIGNERTAKGSVEFDVRVFSSVTLSDAGYHWKTYVKIDCDDVAVGFPGNSSSGKMVGSEKRCKVSTPSVSFYKSF